MMIRQLYLLILLTPCTALAQSCVIDDGIWLQPRTGMTIRNSNIAPCVAEVFTGDKMKIIYTDTDETSIQANELRQWLLALGLPATRITLDKTTTTAPIRLETYHE